MQHKEIIFHSISLEDREWMVQKLKEEDTQACEYTFANNFIWRDAYQVEVAEIEGCGIIRYQENGKHIHSFPFGNGEKKKVIEALKKQCKKDGEILRMSPLVEAQRQWLLREFSGEFEIEADRDDFDYIYATEKLSTLKGKKLHGKRNHIARFKDAKDWEYEPLSEENKAECREMAKEWIAQRQEKWNEEMDAEMKVLNEALEHMEELQLVGGVLRKAGKIVAFTLGEQLNSDTFVVHFEKAYPNLQGAYPMINQQFVLHNCQEYAYVNREEDTGDLGLRKAKLSYYPEILLKKYKAKESRAVFASQQEEKEIRELWKTCFGDEEDYIDLYLSKRFQENNMMVIFEDGKPVSMASFLPVEWYYEGEYHSARYVYAVATHPKKRKKGYASELLKHAAEKYHEPLILQPATEQLAAYYQKAGFQEAFAKYEWECEIAPKGQAVEGTGSVEEAVESVREIGGWRLENITAEEYQTLRDAFFQKEGYVKWDVEGIRYAISENQFCEGEAFKLVPVERTAEEEKERIFLYRVEGETLYVLETSLEPEEFKQFVPVFAEEMGRKKVRMQNAGGMIWLPETWKEPTFLQKGYLNLTLG